MFCWLNRIMISHTLDGGRKLPEGRMKHIRRCDGCRRFYETSLRLAERLKEQAPGDAGVRPYVDLKGGLPPQGQKTRHYAGWSWRAAAAVFVVLAGGIWYWQGTGPAPRPADNRQLQSFADTLYEHGFAADVFASRTDDSLQRLVSHPYQRELSCITEDANRALDFLVASLIPSRPAGAAEKAGT